MALAPGDMHCRHCGALPPYAGFLRRRLDILLEGFPFPRPVFLGAYRCVSHAARGCSSVGCPAPPDTHYSHMALDLILQPADDFARFVVQARKADFTHLGIARRPGGSLLVHLDARPLVGGLRVFM